MNFSHCIAKSLRPTVIFAAAAAALVATQPASAGAQECPLGLVVASVPGSPCAYSVTAARPAVSIGSQGIFQAPAWLVVRGFQAVNAVLGGVVEQAFDGENKERTYLLKAPAGYARVGQWAVDISASGASYDWKKMNGDSATYWVKVDKRGGLFEGATWFGAKLLMVSAHGSRPANQDEVRQIVDQAVAALRNSEVGVPQQQVPKEKPQPIPTAAHLRIVN